MFMNENIDLTKILEGCPKGTEFYHIVYGTVLFKSIVLNSEYPIRFIVDKNLENSVTKSGILLSDYKGECVFFPSKEQRDWSKFVRFWDKPKKERFDPKTFKPFDKVLIRNVDNGFWNAAFFSYIAGQWVNCVGSGTAECIPYNEETKHLVGTTDEAPEYYRYWED